MQAFWGSPSKIQTDYNVINCQSFLLKFSGNKIQFFRLEQSSVVIVVGQKKNREKGKVKSYPTL